MYYPEAVYKYRLSKKLQAEVDSKNKSSPVQITPILDLETWNGMVAKYAARGLLD